MIPEQAPDQAVAQALKVTSLGSEISDPVRISFIEAILKDAGIAYTIRDGHMADVFGQHNGLFPRRLAVERDDAMQAERVLKEADQFYDD